jgi:hypothetical protein
MRFAAALLVMIGCGDNQLPAPDAPMDQFDVLAQLSALPGVSATVWQAPQGFVPEAGYTYYDIEFTQPIDHDHPELGTFQQYAALMWRDRAAPVVLFNGGYNAAWTRNLTEPAVILGANQLSLEYRFYGGSKPASPIDWTKLTVHQNIEDEHAILSEVRPVMGGLVFETGGSKGGENALQHMSLYPNDIYAVVAYVAPVITAKPDLRYATILDDIGTESCRTALRAIQREMLMRRTAMQTRASATDAYAIAGVAHATETSIVELEFAFWMTRGENDCDVVPATTDTDDNLYKFLVATSGPSGYDDATLRASGGQYIYQDQYELGYPVWEHAHLDDLMMFSYEDWSAYLPAQPPHYDPAAPIALAGWLAAAPPHHVLFVGGEWDPWSAGYPPMATSADAIRLTVPHGSHWSTSIFNLASGDRATAVATLQSWAGSAAAVVRRPPGPITARRPVDRAR